MNIYTDPKTGKFKPGNPGRPKGVSLRLTPILKEQLAKVPPGQKETYAELFIKKLLHKAMSEGDPQSLKLIINYVDGLPKQEIGLDGSALIPQPIMDVFIDHCNKKNKKSNKKD